MRGKKKVVASQVRESVALCAALEEQAGIIVDIADAMVRALRRGNQVLLFGNGGSAADADHLAGELAGKFTLFREPLPAISLTASTASLTAIANDFGYEEVFARQVRGLAARGDVVVGLSTSGESSNVVRGIDAARQLGAVTVAFTGAGGTLRDLAHHVLSIPSTDTPRIQEAHMLAGHIICSLVETSLFGPGRRAGQGGREP